MMHMDLWATSLPCDLLLDIFRRLGSTSVIRCAGVCKPWRRAIIDNVSCLRPRPDRFLPNLLLAFFDVTGQLEHVPAADSLLLALESVVDVSLYGTPPLTSRDGFLLLGGRRDTATSTSLCLCNLLAGSSTFLPAAMLGASPAQCAYVLVTGYDYDGDSQPNGAGSSLVQVVAVAGNGNRTAYRIFSSTSGAWGPVKSSVKLCEDNTKVHVFTEPKHAVVCRGAVVYRLVVLVHTVDQSARMYTMFAMDMRAERTWTTELPKQCKLSHCHVSAVVLATSEDGRRPSVITLVRPYIQVWVLGGGDGRWMLQWMVHTQSGGLLPNRQGCPTSIKLSGFCPRSGCFFGIATDSRGTQERFLSSVAGRWSRRMGRVAGSKRCFMLEYELDWSTYISKMKYF